MKLVRRVLYASESAAMVFAVLLFMAVLSLLTCDAGPLVRTVKALWAFWKNWRSR